jgi:hypothetical protein
MTPETRGNIFRVMDGVTKPEMLHLMHQVSNFVRRDEILVWLLRNSMRGEPLLNWFKFEWKHSVFELVKYILGNIDKQKKLKILHGVDYQA